MDEAPGSVPAALRPGRGVLACGLATLDVVQVVDHVPAPDEKLVADFGLVAAGGPALNAAITARLLGHPATLLSAVGTGPVADAIRADLVRWDVRLVDHAPAGTTPAVSTVLVTAGTGERAVVSTNAGRTPALALADGFDPAGAGAVLVDGHHMALGLAVAQAAALSGVPVLLDGGSWKPGTDRLLAHVDVAAVSAAFTLDGRPVRDLADVAVLGPRWVVRTRGGGPVELHDRASGSTVEVPVPAQPVVDTLGAGDVFHGALLAMIAGRPLDRGLVLAAVRHAIEVAGRSVRHPGAHGWASLTTDPAG